MNPHVDPDKCIGCGLCTDICPEAFEMDDDAGVAHATADAAKVDQECLEEAAGSCPVDAIEL
ncbi:MAG: ferredoxin [Limnochordia bacterium]|jgi:ferredoxin|nr:ferredoxin [Limnochordia bacterium]MDD2629036.1 ferredoxin [Limnochordia bacterium]MDD4518398.1 ferredoxin [Limnochordia bacterium]